MQIYCPPTITDSWPAIRRFYYWYYYALRIDKSCMILEGMGEGGGEVGWDGLENANTMATYLGKGPGGGEFHPADSQNGTCPPPSP